MEAVHHELPQTVIVFDYQDDSGGSVGQDGLRRAEHKPPPTPVCGARRVMSAAPEAVAVTPTKGGRLPHPLCKMALQCRQTRASDATRPAQYGHFFRCPGPVFEILRGTWKSATASGHNTSPATTPAIGEKPRRCATKYPTVAPSAVQNSTPMHVSVDGPADSVIL